MRIKIEKSHHMHHLTDTIFYGNVCSETTISKILTHNKKGGHVATKTETVIQKVNSLKGCLAHLRLETGRRQHAYEGEDPLNIDSFISDKMKLQMSKTWRNMTNKTQVFTQPRNTFIRTRQSHTMEVVAIASGIADMLGLNVHLVEAAGYGHDTGHVPFGHQGEHWFQRAMGKPGFCHEKMGPIVTQKIERRGAGLNLCHETLIAMMCHSGSMPTDGMSQEAWVLRYADKFAYIFADINDLVKRFNYPLSKELLDCVNLFGSIHRERVTSAISGLIIESAEVGRVSFEYSELGIAFKKLRTLMYQVYPHVTQQNVGAVMEPVFDFLKLLDVGDPFLLLALMNDKDVIALVENPMKDLKAFNETSISEIVPHLSTIGAIDMCDPGLDW